MFIGVGDKKLVAVNTQPARFVELKGKLEEISLKEKHENKKRYRHKKLNTNTDPQELNKKYNVLIQSGITKI